MEAVRDGWAACALDPGDVLADVLGAASIRNEPASEPPPTPIPALDMAQRTVIEGLRRGSTTLPSLIETAGGAAAALQATTHLELIGLIARSGDHIALTPTGVAVAGAIRREDRDET